MRNAVVSSRRKCDDAVMIIFPLECVSLLRRARRRGEQRRVTPQVVCEGVVGGDRRGRCSGKGRGEGETEEG